MLARQGEQGDKDNRRLRVREFLHLPFYVHDPSGFHVAICSSGTQDLHRCGKLLGWDLSFCFADSNFVVVFFPTIVHANEASGRMCNDEVKF